MDAILTWMAVALGVLLCAAVIVAGWEQLSRRHALRAVPAAPARAVTVDVRLDDLGPEPSQARPSGRADRGNRGNRGNREQALSDALARMAAPPRHGWVDTAPMIAPGLTRARPAQAEASRTG